MFSESAPLMEQKVNSAEDTTIEELQSNIQRCIQALEIHIRKISKQKQRWYEIFYGFFSDAIAFGLIATNIPSMVGYIILSQGTFVLLCGITNSNPYVFPWYKIKCIKYPPLDLVADITGKFIQKIGRDVQSNFPEILCIYSNDDSGAVLRKLKIAEERVQQELNRGKNVINILMKIGVFANSKGPAQLAIEEYILPEYKCTSRRESLSIV